MAGRRHHTVPQFYLRNFADGDGNLRLVNRDDLTKGHLSSVRRALADTGFYRIETEDLARAEDRVGHDPEAVEAALAALEAEMAPAIQILVAGQFEAFSLVRG